MHDFKLALMEQEKTDPSQCPVDINRDGVVILKLRRLYILVGGANCPVVPVTPIGAVCVDVAEWAPVSIMCRQLGEIVIVIS